MTNYASQILEWGRRAIAVEAAALVDLEKSLGEEFVRAVDILFAVQGKVIVTGMGKSGLISRKVASTLASTGTPAFFLHPAESIHGDLGMISASDGLLAISYSGETSELTSILPLVKRRGVPIVSIARSADTTLGKLSDVCLEASVKQEACPHNLAPTASTTASLALGDALAVALLNRRGFTPDDFHQLHPGGQLGRSLRRVEQVMLAGDHLPLVRSGSPLGLALNVMGDKMEGHGRGAVGVVSDKGRLVGIVTDGDLRRAALGGRLAQLDGPVDAVMTPNPKVIQRRALVESAIELMERHSINALFVYDTDPAQPVGILYLHALMKSGAL